jgi:hypothetical protein
LLKHSFIFRSPAVETYFFNISIIFNGNRITLAKSYYQRGTGAQIALGLESPVLTDQRTE